METLEKNIASQSTLPQNTVDMFKEIIQDIEKNLKEVLPSLVDRLYYLDPSEVNQYSNDFDTFSSSMLARLTELKLQMTSKTERAPQPAARQPSTQGSNSISTSHLPRLEPLRFSGKVEEYPEFKRNWLSRFGKLDNDTQLQYLKPSLPSKDQAKVSAVATMELCWERLGKVYGDRQVNLTTVKTNLRNLNLKGSQSWERVLDLHDEVEKSMDQLQVIGAEKEIKTDFDLVSTLVNKLHVSYQLEWDKYLYKNEGGDTPIWDRFWEFLVELNGQAVKSKMRHMSSKPEQQSHQDNKSKNSGKPGGRQAGPTVRSHMTIMQVKTRDDLNKYSADARKNIGACPLCGKTHTYERDFPFGKGKVPSRKLSHCPKFVEKSPADRGAYVEEIKACYSCLDPQHEGNNCRYIRKNYCREKDGGTMCRLKHHKLLHNCGVQYCHSTRAQEPTGDSNVIFEVEQVDVPGVNTLANMMSDPCASGSLITFEFAQSAGLEGRMVKFYLKSTGYPARLKTSTIFTLPLRDIQGREHKIRAFGIEDITDTPAQPNLKSLRHLFPQAPEAAFERPSGKVDILLGANYRELQPAGGLERDGCQREGLRLAESKFGCGWVISGSHRSLKAEPRITNNAQLMTNAVVVEGAEDLPADDELDILSVHLTRQLPIFDFFNAEDLGVAPAKSCGPCNRCQDCDFRRKNITREENEVVERQDSLIKLNSEKGYMEAEYAFTENVMSLQDNIGQGIAFQKSIEKKLLKDGSLESYNAEVQKVLEKGHVKEMTKEDLDQCKDLPTSYISHHPVYKESLSTPVRMVTNSSLKNRTCGLSPNECMGKPPNALSSLLVVFLRWRTKEVSLVLDLTKAYQSIRTPGLLEQSVRRFVWRWGDTEAEWKIYCWLVVTFGDQLASLILELVKNRAAELGKEVDPEAAELLVSSMYVDDLLGGGSWEQVSRFRGTRQEDGSFDGTLAQILGKVGLKAKVIIVTGECDHEILKDYDGKVLGHTWEPQEDTLHFKITVNLSARNRKKERLEADLTLDSVADLKAESLTKARLVGFVNGIYDPTGMLSPITVKFKLELRKLFKKETASLEWDAPIPLENQEAWAKLLEETLRLPTVVIPRSVKPPGTFGRPALYAFFDGSTDAYGTCVYVQFQVDSVEDEYAAQLIASKVRVTSVRGSTTPRSELSGLLICTRLLINIVKAMSDKPSRLVISGDSQCSIAALEKSGDSLEAYFCNRVSEIGQNLEEIKGLVEDLVVEPVQHINGKLNPSDIITRDHATAKDLETESSWFRGPSFLKLPRDQMPLSREFMKLKKDFIPEEERRIKKVVLLLTKLEKEQDTIFLKQVDEVLLRTNSLEKAVNVVARLLKAHVLKDRSRIVDNPTAQELELAKHIILASSMGPTQEAVEQGKLTSLRPLHLNAVYYLQTRAGQSLERVLGCSRPPILMPKSRLAELVMWQAHSEDHRRNPMDTLARSRELAWIVRGSQLARKVCSRCPKCRLSKKKVEQQLMAEIPDHQLKPCPPFTNISLDFMGPFTAKGLGNQRARIKVYGLVIVCQNTRAVKLLTVPGYDTGSFLLAYKKFTNEFGTPEKIVSDQGSQLVKAGKILAVQESDLDKLDWKKIEEMTAKSGATWTFVEAGCQWRNGLVERQVKTLKTTLKNVLDFGQNLNIMELDTLFSSAAYIVNQRPLAVEQFNQESIRCIRPNDLLLGRSQVLVQPGGTYGDSDNIPLRLQLIEDLETLWWEQWSRQVLPSLVPYKRWKVECRNLQVGDVVLVEYAKKMTKADYRLARVTAVHPDPHGVVRTVTVSMRPRDSRERVSDRPPFLPNKPLVELRLGVQRVVVILPVEEQGLEDNKSTLNPQAEPFTPSATSVAPVVPETSQQSASSVYGVADNTEPSDRE